MFTQKAAKKIIFQKRLFDVVLTFTYTRWRRRWVVMMIIIIINTITMTVEWTIIIEATEWRSSAWALRTNLIILLTIFVAPIPVPTEATCGTSASTTSKRFFRVWWRWVWHNTVRLFWIKDFNLSNYLQKFSDPTTNIAKARSISL